MPRAFVPPDFAVPKGLATPSFRLEPLGPEHNERDHAAWTSSIDHIRGTPGFTGSSPHEMSLEDNLRDLERHAADFANGTGFTYTVVDPNAEGVVGCVYIYPARDGVHDARILSWVRASRAELDAPVRQAVAAWLASDWPFSRPDYVGLDPSR